MLRIGFEIYCLVLVHDYLIDFMDFQRSFGPYIFHDFLCIEIELVFCCIGVVYQCCFCWLGFDVSQVFEMPKFATIVDRPGCLSVIPTVAATTWYSIDHTRALSRT